MQTPNAEGKYEYYVIRLVSCDKQSIALCTEIRKMKNCSFDVAKKILTTENAVVVYTIDVDSAKDAKRRLEGAGATVKVTKALSAKLIENIYTLTFQNSEIEEKATPQDEQSSSKKQLVMNILLVTFVLAISLYFLFAKQLTTISYILAVSLCTIRLFTNPIPNRKCLLKVILNIYMFLLGVRLCWEPPIETLHCILFFVLCIAMPLFDLFRFETSKKSKLVALLLCLLLGWCGGHKFYLRKDSAFMYLFFFWTGIPLLFAIWDFIVILLFDTDALALNPEERLAKTLRETNFSISKKIDLDSGKQIFFDDNKCQIMFYNDNPYGDSDYRLLKYSDILDFELSTDGNSRLQGRGLASFAGAVITDTLGLSATAGAVIGSVSGDRKMLQSVTSVIVNLKVNDLQNPFLSVVFLDREVEKDERDCKKALNNANEFMATLAYVKNKTKS